jgi:hypothetical protein
MGIDALTDTDIAQLTQNTTEYDEARKEITWTSLCNHLNRIKDYGGFLPGSMIDIPYRTGVLSRPLPLATWLLANMGH